MKDNNEQKIQEFLINKIFHWRKIFVISAILFSWLYDENKLMVLFQLTKK